MENVPAWVAYAVGIANILQILLLILLIVGLALVGTKIVDILGNIASILDRVDGKIMDNVERMSTDAADTTHNVTSAVNRVANLAGAAATRMESPVIRAVGLASGLVAGARSMRGKKTEVKIEKKRRGFFG